MADRPYPKQDIDDAMARGSMRNANRGKGAAKERERVRMGDNGIRKVQKEIADAVDKTTIREYYNRQNSQ
jgi:hypothetical protein